MATLTIGGRSEPIGGDTGLRIVAVHTMALLYHVGNDLGTANVSLTDHSGQRAAE